MHLRLRTRLALAATAVLVLLAGVGGALARSIAPARPGPEHHGPASRAVRRPVEARRAHQKAKRRSTRKKKTKKKARTKKPSKPASVAAPSVVSMRTEDLNHDGHIDAVAIRLSSAPRLQGLATDFSVAGYHVLSAAASGSAVELRLTPHTSYDTGARPTVTVAGLAGSSGATSSREVMTAADGASPVLISSATADRTGTGRLDAINLLLSEPVSVGPNAISVAGYAVHGTRDYPDGLLTVLLTPGASPDTSALPQVTLDGTELRDGGGNAGPSGAVRLTEGAAPVLVEAQDQGFWLTGERIATFWSAPVHVSGPGADDSFRMTTASGASVIGTAVRGGSAPNEIDVELPLAAETPSTVSYTAAGATTVADAAGLAGRVSPWPLQVATAPPVFAGTLSNPVDPTQMMPFGQRSFYLQPWRSYMDTFPATRMLNAVGINFNVNVGSTDDVDQGARVLHDAGFTRARVSVPWNAMSYTTPGQISAAYLAADTNELQQLASNGIRPLILLDSNDGIPCPVQQITLNLLAAAPAGATTIQLDSASAALVQDGLTGFYQYGRTGGVLITSVNASDVATLSQPLGSALAAGSQTAYDLAYQPFFPEYNSNGSPNATNQATLAGWLQYVAGVTQWARSVLGNDNFDVEVWNELSFGSDFLSASHYYSPAPTGSGNTDQELLQATVSYIRNAANGLPDVGIGDGFSNESPFTSGANEVAGVTAIDKHPYESAVQFPAQVNYSGVAPLDALGQVDGTNVNGAWHDAFVPTFTALLPEYFLTSIQTETVTRDLAPSISDIYGTLHGRSTHPVGAAAPQLWVTEVNADASSVNDTLTSPGGGVSSPMSSADIRHFETKAILRYLSAWVGKGASVIDFFAAANAGGLDVVDPNFFTTAERTHSYPGLAAGGETMLGVRRFLDSMSGAQNLTQVRPLTLDSISDYDGGYQFPGNGTAAFPPLYNRNVLGFFPFQVDAHTWVVPAYVMTRNLATLYNTSAPATDVTRQDLPPEVFRLTLSGLDGLTASASATDPLNGTSVPVKITGRGSTWLSLEIPLTDSPRMLTLKDG